MAGNVNALIAQGIQPPQVASPQQAQAQALTLANAMQEQKIQQQQLAQGQQQLQSGQLDLQQKQYQLAQQKAINSIYQQAFTPTPPPASAGAAGAPGGASPPAGTAPAQAPTGASPPAGAAPAQAPTGALGIDMDKLQSGLAQAGFGSAIPGVLKGFQEYQKTGADLAKAKQELLALEGDHAGAYGAAIRQSGYDPNLFMTSLQREINAGNVSAQQIQPLVNRIAQAMQQDPTGQAAKQLTQQFTDQLIAASPKQRELDTAAQTSATAAARFKAEAPGILADSQLKQMSAAAMKKLISDPNAADSVIEGILPRATDPAAHDSLVSQLKSSAAYGPDGIKPVLAAAGAHAQMIATKTNPIVQRAEADQAAVNARATAPIEVQKAIATAKALRMGDDAAVAGVPPALMIPVRQDAMKIDADYQSSKAAADALGTFLSLAGSGNKMAGSALPAVQAAGTNAINGIKRLNRADIDATGGTEAGNAWDRVTAWGAKNLGAGVTQVPASVLSDMRTLNTALGAQRWDAYKAQLDAVNVRSGARFQPVEPRPGAAPAPAQKPISVGQQLTLKNGKTVTVTAVHPDGSWDGR